MDSNFSNRLSIVLTLSVPYITLCALVYHFFYWDSFGINIGEEMDLSSLVLSFAYIGGLLLGFLLIGYLFHLQQINFLYFFLGVKKNKVVALFRLLKRKYFRIIFNIFFGTVIYFFLINSNRKYYLLNYLPLLGLILFWFLYGVIYDRQRMILRKLRIPFFIFFIIVGTPIILYTVAKIRAYKVHYLNVLDFELVSEHMIGTAECQCFKLIGKTAQNFYFMNKNNTQIHQIPISQITKITINRIPKPESSSSLVAQPLLYTTVHIQTGFVQDTSMVSIDYLRQNEDRKVIFQPCCSTQ